ncbi:MAG: OmpA family protein [Sulfurimonas sp.]|nr:OmpA family protein [Sulfurimonas sp.]MBU1217403.1 OmpA family protein [bacterium]MBU1433936.1 OmpA family protein [bacterium]MBU1503634.1 OmpA family protein [bacterium]MBU3938744.1 OmpA family protein [bacterium]
MINNLNTLNTKLVAVSLLMTFSLYAGTYDENYMPLKDANKSIQANDNTIMDGEFKEIIRFNMLSYDDDSMDEASKKILSSISDTIKAYKANSQNVLVSIIGHTSATSDDANEKTIDSNTYANHIQNWFRDSFDTNESQKVSKEYAQDTQKALIDAGVDENIIRVEYRGSADLGFTDETGEGKDLSNRVMVALYVLEPQDIDSDKDGVFDMSDKCQNTPRNTSVDEFGCPVDSDMDGVLDYKDECPQTPESVPVDTKGCPLDSDKDGVLDYKDKCLDTPNGVQVDLNGCPLSKTLALRFQTASDTILSDSYSEIEEFALFMKNNQVYKAEIIGHTDSVGKAESNMKLSKMRAESTKAALVANGVEASRISTTGRGELEPLQSNRTSEGREANRRIEVKLSY